MSYTNISASFNGIDLTSVSGLSILATDAYKPPRRAVKKYGIARTNSAKVTTGYYEDKQITITVNIVAATRDLAEANLDTLNRTLQPIERDLIVRQSNVSRKYTATYSDYVIRKAGGSYIEADLVFDLSDMFGYDLNPTQITNQAGLTSTYNAFSWTQGGSADTQAPTITIQYTAIGNPSVANTVTITNLNTSASFTVNRIWSAGDMLTIDSRAGTVKVNGSDVAFSGSIPLFSTGAQYMSVTDTFSTRTFSINALVYNRWI